MAKDDYHVIVFKILAYLYTCLKQDKKVEENDLKNYSKLYQINENYWAYIITNIQESGLIEGADFAYIDGKPYPIPVRLGDCRITPYGIEYLCDNALMKKVYDYLKKAKDLLPGIEIHFFG